MVNNKTDAQFIHEGMNLQAQKVANRRPWL